MTAKSLPKDEPGADERFDRAIKKALATPPQPKKAKADNPDAPAPKNQ